MTCEYFAIGIARRQITGGFFKPFEHQQRRIVPYSPEKYFNVVLDVEKYQNFIPWCQESSVQNAPWNGNPCSFSAEVVIGFKLFKERYTSIVTYNRPHWIQVSAIDSSIFSKLINEWKFSPGPDSNSAYVDFRVDFQFSNILHQQAAGYFIEELTSIMTSSFDDRVAALYGGKQLSDHMKNKSLVKQEGSFSANSTALLQIKPTAGEVICKNIARKDISPSSAADSDGLRICEKDILLHWSELLLRVQGLVDRNKLSSDDGRALRRKICKMDSGVAIVFHAFDNSLGRPISGVEEKLWEERLLGHLKELLEET
ncbi:polyketide cyclase/dehydrase [Cardiosporidium cionae]|uniref:Polyketide cyclase/dehydrase n=1 Tax=Cardiosporidium cionae TaxID=476202 RepID=A0ABQ7JFG7_9APIC|nr:polyketide cyclase/dehydrase [Cardiosporidium cionae]|eukprot:KAF8822694.1 polyketide cyclase/dehydrase [Cardiosporidium cionae]